MMIDQVAVPFWLCLTVGLVIGLQTGNERLWIVISAAAGLVLGLVLGMSAVARRRAAFQRGKAPVTATPAPVTSVPPQDVPRAA